MRKLMIAASVLLFSAAMCAQEVPVEMKWLDDVPQSVMDSRLYGKRMVIMGDSYVKNHVRPVSETWHYKLAAKYHMEYHNYGWNGNCIAFDRTAQGFGPALCERYVTMTDNADYVIVMIGHNDAGYVARDPEALTLVREKLTVLCEGLVRKYPSAKIAFITPWNVPRAGFDQINSLLHEVCGLNSIPVFDAARNSGIHVRDEQFRSLYFQSPGDTAHLNDAGHNLVLSAMESFILGL